MRTYKRKTNWVNTTGYKDNVPTNQNTSNTIPSNNISMSRTSQPLRAQGVNAQGYPVTDEVVLQPGEQYLFDNTFAVVEEPIFQTGGSYLTPDIRTFPYQDLSFGYDPTAYPNYGVYPTTGGIQSRGFTPYPQRVPVYGGTSTANPYVGLDITRPIDSAPPPVANTQQPTSTVTISDEELGIGQTNSLSTDSGINDWNRAYLTGVGQPQGYAENYNVQGTGSTQANVQNRSTTQAQQQRFQFFNPYVGMDLAGSSYLLGQAIQSGDTTGTVLSGARLGLGLGRNLLSGMGFANRNQQIAQSYAEQQRDGMTQANRPQYLQDGGQKGVNIVQQISQLLSEGVTPEEIYQALVQEGYPEADAQAIIEQATNSFQDGGQNELELAGRTQQETIEPEFNAELEDGEWILDSQGLRQVVGEDHEDGGVNLNLEKGTQILSNHLKVGAKLSRELNKEYDVKISVKDTYAKALEKIYNKVGLNKLMEDHAELIEKMEKQADTDDETTMLANVEVLSKQMKEIEDEKAPLEQKAIGAFASLFSAQEESKPKENVTDQEFQEGGTNLLDRVRATAPQYTDIERELILSRYQGHQTPETVAELQRLLNEGRLIYNRGTLDRLQSGENLGLPTLVQGQDATGTFGQMDDQRTAGYVYNDVYSNLYGSTLNYGDREVMEEWNPRIKQGLQDLGINYRTSVRGENDNAFGTITSEQPGVIAELPGQVEGNFDVNVYRTLTDAEKVEFAREAGVDKEALDTLVTNPAVVQFRTTPSTEESKAPTIDGITSDNPDVSEDDESTAEDGVTEGGSAKRRTGLLPTADTTQLPPSAQQAHLRTNRRYERADFVGIDPEQQLTELNRLTSRVQANLDNLPPSQRAAVEANMLATQAQQTAQILNQTQQYNTQEFNRIQNINNQIQMQEENAAAQDALNYEQRQFLAQAKTEADYRNFYNAIQRQNQQNFMDVNRMNLLNNLYSDFQFTDQGIEAVGDNVTFTNRFKKGGRNLKKRFGK